jgi:uncharacterized MAPEG superfamily protein
MTPMLWMLIVACGLPYLPHMASAQAKSKLPGGYNNREPRVQAAALEGWGRRANAAHLNTFEALPPFLFAGLLVAHVGADGMAAAGLAAGWVALRIAYVAAYLADAATPRSLAWMAASGCTLGLFGLAIAHPG